MKLNLFSQSKNQRGTGFTLIEVMVSLAILAILAALAAPNFSASIKKYRINAIRDDFTGSIHLARSEAIRRSVPVILTRTTGCSATLVDVNDWSCGWEIVVDANSNGSKSVGELVLQTTNVPDGYGVMHPGKGASLSINVWGQTSAAFGRFVLTPPEGVSGKTTTTVCINSGGRVRSFQDAVTCP
jgi:type IV fimbrial biogenesis protein FimT